MLCLMLCLVLCLMLCLVLCLVLCRLPSSYVWLCSQCLRSQPAPCHPPVHTLPHPHTLLSNQTRMNTLKPFIFGGIASLTAEVGKLFFLLNSLHTSFPLPLYHTPSPFSLLISSPLLLISTSPSSPHPLSLPASHFPSSPSHRHLSSRHNQD